MLTIGQIRTQISDRPRIFPTNTEPPDLIGIADGTATIFTLRYENFIPGTLTIYEADGPPSGSGETPDFTAVSTTPPIVVGTTSETAVVAPGAATITPASMANIGVGDALLIDISPNQEVVIVTGVTSSTFTAIFALAHEVGFAIAGAPPYLVGSPNQNENDTLATNATIAFSIAPTPAGTLIASRSQVTAFSDDDLAGYYARAQPLYADDLTALKRVQYDIIDVLLMDYDRLYLLAQGDFRTDAASYAESLKQLKAELRQDLFGGPVAGAAVPAAMVQSGFTPRYQPLR